MATVDIAEALAIAEPMLEVWWVVRQHPDSPPFSGGIYDAWPALDADVIAVARLEEQVAGDYVRWRKREKRG